jgi:hypothetical protein
MYAERHCGGSGANPGGCYLSEAEKSRFFDEIRTMALFMTFLDAII